MKRLFYLVIIFFMLASNINPEENTDDLKNKYIEKIKNLDENAKIGKNYLLLIAIDKYKNRLHLEIHINNAVDIRNTLYEKYYIDNVIELFDYKASKNAIINKLRDLKRILRPQDSLIIYYGGHGYYDEKNNEAYWLPYDAGINENLKENWLSNDDIMGLVGKISADHIFLIVDSCFSDKYIKEIVSNKNFNDDYFKKSLKNKSRQILASGEKETGSISSEFIDRFKKAIKRNNKPYLDPVMIYEDIKDNVEPPVLFGEAVGTGHNKDGSYLFVLRQFDSVKYEDVVVEEDDTEKYTVTDDKLIEKEKELAKKEKELKKKEERLKEMEEGKKGMVNPKIVNITGIALCPVGGVIALAGLGLLLGDLVGYANVVQDKIDNKTTYRDYETAYTTFIALFASSIGITVLGLGIVGLSIPLILFKRDFKKIRGKTELSLNIEFKNDIKFYLNYLF